MPAKIDADSNLRFLYSCFKRSNYSNINYQAVATDFDIKAPAARMRLMRLKLALDSDLAAEAKLKAAERAKQNDKQFPKGGKGGKGVLAAEHYSDDDEELYKIKRSGWMGVKTEDAGEGEGEGEGEGDEDKPLLKRKRDFYKSFKPVKVEFGEGSKVEELGEGGVRFKTEHLEGGEPRVKDERIMFDSPMRAPGGEDMVFGMLPNTPRLKNEEFVLDTHTRARGEGTVGEASRGVKEGAVTSSKVNNEDTLYGDLVMEDEDLVDQPIKVKTETQAKVRPQPDDMPQTIVPVERTIQHTGIPSTPHLILRPEARDWMVPMLQKTTVSPASPSVNAGHYAGNSGTPRLGFEPEITNWMTPSLQYIAPLSGSPAMTPSKVPNTPNMNAKPMGSTQHMVTPDMPRANTRPQAINWMNMTPQLQNNMPPPASAAVGTIHHSIVPDTLRTNNSWKNTTSNVHPTFLQGAKTKDDPFF